MTSPARHRSGVRRAWRAGGALLAAAGVVAIGFAVFTLVEKSRSGSDAALFNYTVPPEALTGLPPQGAPVPGVDAARYSSLYPGDRMNPRYWDEPLWAGSSPFGGPGVPPGFEPVSANDLSRLNVSGQASPAVRMRIGAIGLDSAVAPLQIVNLDDQREYETPNNVVGFIPETAAPGQPSTGWYFGHLQSLVLGEGSVFNRLPEVAGLIREDPVDIILDTVDGEYLYRVKATRQVAQSKLALSERGAAGITLVTCWPPRVYDQRILVEAELIAVRRA
jgi:sortase (surface protein transpeptidase)